MKTILLFVDGLGWGAPDSAHNPQYSYGGTIFRLPAVAEAKVLKHEDGFLVALDAVLGVSGLPQSATGQTTLLSGVNAQEAIGKHLTGFPNEALREILKQKSILKQLVDRGYQARFINAFRPRFWELSEERKWTLSATTVATLAAGLPFFNLDDVNAGRSVYQEFTNAELRQRGFEVEPMTPGQAGSILASQILKYDFLLFEYFQTDRAGHAAVRQQSEHQLSMLEEFLRALLKSVSDEVMVLLTSDHGNLEDLTTRRHTRNPVPLLAWGESAEDFLQNLNRLDQVTGAILARHPG